MAKDKRTDSLQSGENAPGFGQREGEFGAGGQRDQNVGGQQHQQRDPKRDRKLKAGDLDPSRRG